jgi:putative transposase
VVAAFIDEHRDQFGVEPICRVLTAHGVKTAASTYYAHHSRPPSARSLRDEQLGEQIERIFHDRRRGRGLAGVRKMWRLLRREHEVIEQFGPIARCTVERLMRARGLQGVRRHRGFATTRPAKNVPERAPDLVKRNFHAAGPNKLWVVDLTYVACWEHMGFTAFVTDVYSRRIVGWRTAARMPVDLPLDALEMALWIRARTGHADPDGRLTGLIHHSDAGSVYTALRYVDRLDDAGALASIGTVGDSYDNALAESTNGLYKTECVWHDGPFVTVGQLELATADWVEWFNTNRLHSSLDYLPPVEFEAAYYAQPGPQEAA